MFRTILAPLDGSRLAEAALPHVAALARAFDARVVLLRVVPMRRRGGAAPLDMIDRRLEQAEARAYLDALAAELQRDGIAVDVEVTKGHPADRILESMSREPPGVVVLTTHGAGGSSPFRLSGTAYKVISLAGTSVLLIPACGDDAPRAGYERVLVATDCSRQSDCALDAGSALARAAGAELVLLHVVALPATVSRTPLTREHRTLVDRLTALNRKSAETWLAGTQARLVAGSDLRVRTRIETAARVIDTLCEVADAERSDLVVLAAHGASTGTDGRYGGLATQALVEARRPLLIVQEVPRVPAEPPRAAAQEETELAPRHR
jgi:nucleotide-binding universal stress UspA family protein